MKDNAHPEVVRLSRNKLVLDALRAAIERNRAQQRIPGADIVPIERGGHAVHPIRALHKGDIHGL